MIANTILRDSCGEQGQLVPDCHPMLARANTASLAARPSSVSGGYSVIPIGAAVRVALMLTPQPGGSLADQVAEVIVAQREILGRQPHPMFLPMQTVFLRTAVDQAICEKLFSASGLHRETITHYVVQPPFGEARLAVEAWALGGPDVTMERLSNKSVSVGYDGIRWVYFGDVRPTRPGTGVYAAATDGFQQGGRLLAQAGLGWEQVVRTWWYLGDITGTEGQTERYAELNRARADAFEKLHFGSGWMRAAAPHAGYPASTGIGTAAGTGLSLAALAMQTSRNDVTLLSLESPVQTPAYEYAARYSPQSPKFSRAMSLITPDYVTTWVSGTASVVHSEACHPGNVVAQTEQTLDNIKALIAADNFACHGQMEAGATLQDLAKVRVYVKRAADYADCRAVCERRLGNIPAIYVAADVCRPELLVEIEGVAFSRRQTPSR
jgi:enamine deaminase RidA (YjgF/YER057c/UK114 family)